MRLRRAALLSVAHLGRSALRRGAAFIYEDTMKPFNVSGNWWIARDDARLVGGTLSFSFQDGITLTLLGSIDIPSDPIENLTQMFGVIVGPCAS